MNHGRLMRYLSIAGTLTLAACATDDPATPPVPREIASVSIVDSVTLLSIGQPHQLTALALDADGEPVSAEFTWRSSETAVLTVSNDGVVTPISHGSATVTAAAGGLTAKRVFLVLRPEIAITEPVLDFAVDPGDPVAPLAVAPQVINTGGKYPMTLSVGDILYTYPIPAPWLSVSLAGTTLPSALSVTVTAAGLPRGNYQADARIIATATIAGVPTVTSRILRVRLQVGGYTSVSSGFSDSCALSIGGIAWCWGSNEAGQVGNGTTAPAPSPVRVAGDHRFTQITQGLRHTCAATTARGVWCWGSNVNGQLGTGNGSPSAIPTGVVGVHNFVEVRAGMNHTCARETNGSLWCWGDGTSGQLGSGALGSGTAPTRVASVETFAAIAAGRESTCALTTDGRAFCWGDNAYGQLGDGTTTRRLVPTPVATVRRFSQISVGFLHACARTSNGIVECWGSNVAGQLGDGTQVQRNTPVTVNASESFVDLQAGVNETAAITAFGTLYWWGGNNWVSPVGNFPQYASALGTGPGPLALGGFHACRVHSSKDVYCWGQNQLGQMGLGGASVGGIGYTKVLLP